jgi:pimeloyl-ACP methyl ester carboxylesterase
MLTTPIFAAVLPTWRSLSNDYLSELKHFRKKWLAIFGDSDVVVPTEASIRNIQEFMTISGNEDYVVAVIPRCGHAPVDTRSKRRITFENLVLNWLGAYVLGPGE